VDLEASVIALVFRSFGLHLLLGWPRCLQKETVAELPTNERVQRITTILRPMTSIVLVNTGARKCKSLKIKWLRFQSKWPLNCPLLNSAVGDY
jgi:hypothetical protein